MADCHDSLLLMRAIAGKDSFPVSLMRPLHDDDNVSPGQFDWVSREQSRYLPFQKSCPIYGNTRKGLNQVQRLRLVIFLALK